MTIEQAKSELMQIYGALSPDKQRAIDTLVKIEPCEDAISRKDVEECKELMTDINGDTVYAVRMSDIRQLSSVNPQEPKTKRIEYGTDRNPYKLTISNGKEFEQEPKIGHWISLDDFRGKYNERGFKCSECDEHSSFEESFCPGCGAKMIEPQESEDKE